MRSGLPNQDAIQWYPRSGLGPPLILAVSDGHGSPRNFRSDVGAALAVAEATTLIKELLLEGQPDPDKLSAIKRTAEERIPEDLVRRWRDAVAAHRKQHPITEEDLENLERQRDARARRSVEKSPHLAYGATLLSVMVTSSFLVYVQLGDGDILTVLESGEVTRPMPRDARLMANQTTSLCMDEAWREVHVRFQTLYGPRPALILLATDGYANSFVNEAAFLKVGSDIFDILHTEGLSMVEENMETWLQEASKSGSGDDITMGLLFPESILPPPAARPPRRDEGKTEAGKTGEKAAEKVEKKADEGVAEEVIEARPAPKPQPPEPVPAEPRPKPAPKVPEKPAPKKEEPEPSDEIKPSEKAQRKTKDAESAAPEAMGQQEAEDRAEVRGGPEASAPPEEKREEVASQEGEGPEADDAPTDLPVGAEDDAQSTKPKLELIKEEDGPREPSKRLPNILYSDED